MPPFSQIIEDNIFQTVVIFAFLTQKMLSNITIDRQNKSLLPKTSQIERRERWSVPWLGFLYCCFHSILYVTQYPTTQHNGKVFHVLYWSETIRKEDARPSVWWNWSVFTNTRGSTQELIVTTLNIKNVYNIIYWAVCFNIRKYSDKIFNSIN